MISRFVGSQLAGQLNWSYLSLQSRSVSPSLSLSLSLFPCVVFFCAVYRNQLWSAFVNGFRCLMGTNIIVPPHCSMSPSTFGEVPCDQCPEAWVPVTLYIVFNALFNVFTVLLIKYGSSTLMFVIMTLRLPLLQVAFSIKVSRWTFFEYFCVKLYRFAMNLLWLYLVCMLIVSLFHLVLIYVAHCLIWS